MYQIQTWQFGFRFRSSGVVTHTVGDPSRASDAIRSYLTDRNVREIVIWRPDHTVSMVNRESPDSPWRTVKGAMPEMGN